MSTLSLDDLGTAARRRFGLVADCSHLCPELPISVCRLPLSMVEPAAARLRDRIPDGLATDFPIRSPGPSCSGPGRPQFLRGDQSSNEI